MKQISTYSKMNAHLLTHTHISRITLYAAFLFIGVMWSTGSAWGTPASVGTVMYSENWGGYSNTDVPDGSVSSSTGYRVVYSGSVTYTCSNGTKTSGSTAGGTTKVTTDNSGNLAGGTSPELMVGKKGSGEGAVGGKIEISGIPCGEADSLTLSYKQNGNSLQVSISGTGYKIRNGSSDVTSVSNSSANTYTYAIVCGSGSTFTLTFQAGSTKNVRLDDISITVRTAGSSGSTYSITYADASGIGTNGSYSASSTSGISSGTTITLSATPASCYQLDEWSVYKTGDASTTVTVTNNQFTMPAYGVTVGASFEAKAAGKTVNFDAGPGVSASSSLTETCDGSGVTLPAVTATGVCKGWTTFAGWATSAVSDSTTTSVTVYSAGSKYTPASDNMTLYAVYSKVKGGAGLTSVVGGNMSSSLPSGWSKSGAGQYSGNGVKFDDEGDWILSPDFSSQNLTKVTVKFKAGNNGSAGSVLRFEAIDKDGYEITGVDFSPTEAYDNQSTENSVVIDAGEKIYTIAVELTDKTSNVGMKYCEVFKSSSTTYYCSDPNCCTALASINGSVSWSNVATAVVSWDNIDHVSSWTVKYKTHAAGDYSTWAGEQTVYTKSTTNDSRKVTITGLTPCTDYDFQIIANPASGYCDKDQTIEDDQAHAYSVDYSGCSNVTKTAGGTTACGSSNLVATFTASLPYELPSTVSVAIGGAAQTQGTDFTWSVAAGVGTLTIGSAKQTGNIVVDVDGNLLTCDVNPTIGTATLDGSGTFSLTSVSVSVTDCSVEGVVCEWTDYGFVWGTSANPTGNKMAIGSDGTATSWSGALTGEFETGTTYYYRAYGKNSKDGAAIVYGTDATFIPRSVTFNANGGSDVATKYVASGGTVSAPSAPTRNGYTFGGWYTDNGTWKTAVDWSSTISANVTYYAKWNAITYTISYEGLEGASNENPTSYNIETPTITLVDPGEREGYTFAGWTLGGSPVTQIAVGSTGDKTITANWSIHTPNLAVSAADHVVITATPASELAIAEGANRNVNYNKTITLNCTPDEHWNLVWDVYKTGESSTKVALSGSGNGATFAMPDYAVTVNAVMTEAAYKTVCFKNNGEDIDGYGSVKVYVGERPVAPTLTDGTSGDACDATSDKHYGWTQTEWTDPIALKSEIDARTGVEAVYAKSAALPVVAAEDPSTITYHAVWAAGEGAPVITPPTPIVYWAKQSLSTGNSYSATSGSGSLSTNVSMTSNSYPYVYTNINISSAPVITLSSLDLSGASSSTVSISFFTRGSKASAGPLTVSYYNNSAWTDLATTATVQNGEVAYHEIAGIPKTATSVKLTHSASSGSFSIGTIRIFEPNTTEYTFTELDGTNTDGWTNSDWDGYYLITNASTYALDGNGIGAKNFATVSPSDNKIVTTNIGAAFEVTYVSENGYKIQGVGSGDYLNTADNSVAPSASVIYHSSMSYNSVVDNSSNTLKWNSSKFGFYASAGTAIKLYKILASYSTFLTTCCATKVTLSKNNPEHGTVEFSSSSLVTCGSDKEVTLTITPAAGYQLHSYEVATGSGKVATKSVSPAISLDNNSSAAQNITLTFAEDANGAYDVTASFTEMVASAWTWTKHVGGATITTEPVEVYVGQKVQVDVSYEPAGLLSNHTNASAYNYSPSPWSNPNLGSPAKAGDHLTVTGTNAGSTSVVLNHNDGLTKTIYYTVLALPLVHFVDNIHGETFANVVATVSGDSWTVTTSLPTPTHSDVSDPGSDYNSCERQHIHLVGWIRSDWANEHPGASHSQITSAGNDDAANPYYYTAGADIDVEAQDGQTFYAVWSKIE